MEQNHNFFTPSRERTPPSSFESFPESSLSLLPIWYLLIQILHLFSSRLCRSDRRGGRNFPHPFLFFLSGLHFEGQICCVSPPFSPHGLPNHHHQPPPLLSTVFTPAHASHAPPPPPLHFWTRDRSTACSSFLVQISISDTLFLSMEISRPLFEHVAD